MKNTILTLAITLASYCSYGQTNTFPASGNVGIGTTSPQAILDIGKILNYGELGSILARLPEGNSVGTGTYLGIKAYDTSLSGFSDVKSFAIKHSFYGETNSSINFLRGGDSVGGCISFSTNNNTEKMRILSNGNVGIGTVTPDSKLAVNGNIRAKEVKVELAGWSDFVFAKDYKLPTLQETEKHIKENGHLPGIPSAAEVKANGIDLGKMNAKLLQKIEELTLYLIEQNKQFAKQEAINSRLNNHLSLLDKENKTLKDKIK